MIVHKKWNVVTNPAPTGSPGQPALEHASLPTKFTRLRQELKIWNAAGRPRTPRSLRKLRQAICRHCEYFDPAGNWHLGECHAPGCGCTQLKTYLLTSKCPHPNGSRWPG